MANKLNKSIELLIGVLTPIVALLTAFIVLCIVTMSMYSPKFLGRVLTHWDSKIDDYKFFSERVVQKSSQPYTYAKNINSSLQDINVEYSNNRKPLKNFVKSTDTTSFIIVKNDEIVYEQYANGYDENSINTSFSMAKSVISLLIGKAVENGDIKSVQDPISKYITEFENKRIGEVTIEELLLMRSGIAYDEDKFLWFGDDTLTYWHDDLRKLALEHTDIIDGYNGDFHYNNYHPLLLGIILERCTGKTVSRLFECEIWQKIGAQYNASWSMDSRKSGFEKMESGINFKSVDFIKFGSMVLHGGYWNGTRIIGEDWLNTSTMCEFPINSDEYANSFLADKNIGYRYMWYCTPSARTGYDIAAWGKSDQILYISPSNGTVILRTGKTDGGVSNWVEVLRKLASEV